MQKPNSCVEAECSLRETTELALSCLICMLNWDHCLSVAQRSRATPLHIAQYGLQIILYIYTHFRSAFHFSAFIVLLELLITILITHYRTE